MITAVKARKVMKAAKAIAGHVAVIASLVRAPATASDFESSMEDDEDEEA